MTKSGVASNTIDYESKTANMYGCQPCPKCGSVYRAPYTDSKAAKAAGFDVIECDCGFVEEAVDAPTSPPLDTTAKPLARASNQSPIEDVLLLARAYYQRNPTGGHLHIVLDDENLRDKFVDHCIARAEEAGDEEAVTLAKAIRALSMTQRKKLCSRYDEYAFGADETEKGKG